MKPLISIITLTYNQAEYLRECIASVTAQTYSNWELIIVDDCSTDDTENSAKILTYHDKRMKYIRHTDNWGIPRLAETYNEAVATAKGEYIAILEGDDKWPKDYLEKQLNRLLNAEGGSLVFSDWIVIDDKNRYVYYRHNKIRPRVISSKRIVQMLSDLSFVLLPAACVIKKQSLLSIEGFHKGEYYPFVDIPTFLKLSLTGSFICNTGTFAYYRKHKDSTWYTHASRKKESLRKEISKEYLKFIRMNESVLNKLGWIIDIKQISADHSKYLMKKRENKKLNELAHLIMYEDVYEIRRQYKLHDFFIKFILLGILILKFFVDKYIKVRLFIFKLLD